ncbi:MAG: 4-hydroxy-2-oxo-heptane-1,7-dioate aldolase, partial [Rhizorhabdus sp.]
VMIETMLGYQNIDAILDVEGVDGIFIGNNDLSFDMTRGKSLEPMSPEVLRICEQCMKKARARGKYGAIFLTQIQFMRSYLEMGFQMFVGGLDSRALVDTGNRFVAEAKAEFRA